MSFIQPDNLFSVENICETAANIICGMVACNLVQTHFASEHFMH